MSEVATHPSQRRLGRGLSALLGGGAPAHEESEQQLQSELRQLPTAQLTRNPFQPRKHFDPESIGELASSIKEHGVLQPVLVREVDSGFQIIAGERRWQAAQKAGLTSIPCRVVDVVDKTACEFALEENLKRKDLNDLEKAQAFRDYLDQFQCSIEELSKQLSMKRSTVSNMLRLLELPDPVKNALNHGRITAGHARALLPMEQSAQLELCSRIQAEQLSVRATEAAVKKLLGREPAPAEVPNSAENPGECSSAGGEHQPHPEHQGQPDQQQAGEGSAEHHDQQHHEHSQGEAAHHEQSQSAEHHQADGHADGGHHEGEHHHDGQPETIPMHAEESFRTNHVDSLEAQLRDVLGVHVEIQLTSKENGRIIVPFGNNHEFERILEMLRRNAAA